MIQLWLDVFRENRRILLFGILAIFFSAPGQTFLVSVFTPAIQKEFSLSSFDFGWIYSLGTCVGSLALLEVGKLVDRWSLRRVSLLVGLLLAAGCTFLGMAGSVWMLVVGFILIRAFGQGSMSLLSSASVAKGFVKNRGKALGFASIGFPMATATTPILIAWVIQFYGWRQAWYFEALCVLLIFLPVAHFLLPREKLGDFSKTQPTRLSNKQLLLSPMFFGLIVLALSYPFTMTGLFLYQAKIAAQKNWSIELMATAFIGFSATRLLLPFVSGFLVDKIGARPLFHWIFSFLFFSLLALHFGRSPVFAFLYMAGVGAGIGFAMSVQSAYLVEIFGSEYVGQVKGLLNSFMIFATSLSPILFGWVVDHPVWMARLLPILCVWSFFLWLYAYFYSRRERRFVVG